MEKTDNIKNTIFWIIVAIVLAGGWSYRYFKDKQSEKISEDKTQAIVSQREQTLNGLVARYGAVDDWDKDLTYTIQAQERLIIDRPILFRAYVDDIFRRNEKTYIRASSSYFDDANYILELDCDDSIVNKILSNRKDDSTLNYFADYAIVANIQEVIKPILSLNGSVASEDEAEIDIESSSSFIAKGLCVDLESIED